jgi:hypothetical protein
MAPAASSAVLLATWEQAYGLGAAAKGIALLSLALPERTYAELRSMSIGQRDSALLTLRAELFGQQLSSVVPCPACHDRIELRFCIDDVRVSPPARNESVIQVNAAKRQLVARSLTSDDLLAVDPLEPGEPRRRALIRRCVRSIDGEPLEDFSPDEVRDIATAMAACDPQADVTIAVDCARCGRQWSSRFDVVRFLWLEVDAWAQRLLAEVHALANAYGWAERAVIAMSPWRRQIYLEMLRQ